MVFNSVAYALFLPVVVAGHWMLRGRARMAWLLGASYLFYGAWDWRFLGLLWFSTAVDFVVAQLIDSSDDDRRRRRLLTLSLTTQLALLATFKYFDFFIESASGLLEDVGLGASEWTLEVILPVGISFYTFQTMAYTIDVYRRRTPACRDVLLFATFVAYFPQLVAGPIERAHHMLPQIAADRRLPSWDRVESALVLILLGLVLKVVVGDSVAPVVNDVFADPEGAGSIGALAGVIGFAIQIYADFAGYTAIARGSSRLLGIELMHNFREPYLSRHITEFWRRWHISLSSWLRDYLYVPLGGNRRGEGRTYVNLMLTMLLGGLWHGAGWNFVIWGGLHGMYLAAHRWRRRDAPVEDRLPTRPRDIAAVLGTFALVCFAWIFFRAPSASDAWDVIAAIGAFDLSAEVDKIALVPIMGGVVLALDILSRMRHTRAWRPERRPVLAGAAVGFAVALLIVFSGGEPVPFVYFQF
jgi:D-alanyl-lipoteichoic acid acyltransferase DltB (MBOAT superfamily)